MKISYRTLIARGTLLVIAALFAGPAIPVRKVHGASPEPPPAVAISIDTGSVINTMRGGIGASWHAIEKPIPIGHGGSAWGAYPPAENERAWQQIYQHASWLGLDWNRVEIEQRIYEPERGKFTFDSPEMKILYRILDWNQKSGTDVFFQQMWCNTEWLAYPEFRKDPIKRVHSAPQDLQAFADGLATLMEHLIKKRGYTCIKWLCITNEPGEYWSWWNSPNGPLSIGPGLVAVRNALARHGVNLPLSGPGASAGGFPATVPDNPEFRSLLGAYDFHDYIAGFDFQSTNLVKKRHLEQQEHNVEAWAKFSHAQGKPVFLTEFGAGGNWPAPPSDPKPGQPESALAVSELIVRNANAGMDGFNRWSFLNRGDLDGQWQYIDTWDVKNRKLLTDFVPHANSYFGVGLLSRFIAKHSQVLASKVSDARVKGWQRVFCAAFRSEKGNVTVVVVNDAPVEFPLKLSWGGKPPAGKFFRYRYGKAEYDRADVKVNPQPDFSPSPGNSWEDTLPPTSLTIYSTYQLKHDQAGIISDEALNGSQ